MNNAPDFLSTFSLSEYYPEDQRRYRFPLTSFIIIYKIANNISAICVVKRINLTLPLVSANRFML